GDKIEEATNAGVTTPTPTSTPTLFTITLPVPPPTSLTTTQLSTPVSTPAIGIPSVDDGEDDQSGWEILNVDGAGIYSGGGGPAGGSAHAPPRI
ncbi:MAG: hypothetical protein M4579_006971, partial [Chaenotheca gracillima]